MNKKEIFSVLKRYNFEIDQKRGSHVVVRHRCLINQKNFGAEGEFTVPVKSGQVVKGRYLKQILKAISLIEEEGE
ncbi:MAG: type II toxin-antitoxin system HicA family toxin [candidate division KSB1 bacterium]|nr:type II toxin-antitoxin system HicA family toxin [candidate division KSB1 bacterium]